MLWPMLFATLLRKAHCKVAHDGRSVHPMQDSGARGKVEAMHLDLSSFRHAHVTPCDMTSCHCLFAVVEAMEVLLCPPADQMCCSTRCAA